MEGITIELPEITAVSVAPNPVDTGESIQILVTAETKTVTRYPDYFYSGELYAESGD